MCGVGGTERMVEGLSRLLGDSYEVIQCSFDAPGSKRSFESSTPLLSIGPFPPLPLALRVFIYLLAAWRLRCLKRQEGVDLTISNLWRADLVSLISGGCDKKICLAHINIVGNPSNRLMIRFRAFVSFIYRRADKVIAVSEPLANELRLLFQLSASKIGYIRNFIFLDRAPGGSSQNTSQIVWCGRFVEEKDPLGAVRLWAKYLERYQHSATLIMLGDGPLLDSCKDLAKSLGLRAGNSKSGANVDIVFTGFVSDPKEVIGESRGLMLTSRHEGVGLVLLEAMSLGVPVLVADCPSGGACDAVSAKEKYDPSRTSASRVEGGWLLPMTNKPNHQDVWILAISECLDETYSAAGIRSDILQRAALFSPHNALSAWAETIEQVLSK